VTGVHPGIDNAPPDAGTAYPKARAGGVDSEVGPGGIQLDRHASILFDPKHASSLRQRPDLGRGHRGRKAVDDLELPVECKKAHRLAGGCRIAGAAVSNDDREEVARTGRRQGRLQAVRNAVAVAVGEAPRSSSSVGVRRRARSLRQGCRRDSASKKPETSQHGEIAHFVSPSFSKTQWADPTLGRTVHQFNTSKGVREALL